MQIFVSDKAIQQINKEISKRTQKPLHVRFGVKGAGCYGHEYFFEFEDRPAKSTDHIFTFDQITIIVDRKSILLLNGTTIDYQETLMERGYIFHNPNQTSACSCGKSFST